MNQKKFSMMVALAAMLALFGQMGLSQAPQGIVPIPSNNNIQVDVTLAKTGYAVGEEIQIVINTIAPSVSHVYLNVVDIDAAGICTLIFPNAYSPNPLVPVGTLTLSDKPNLYRFQVVPPFGAEHVQAFASLDPLNLSTLFNSPVTPGNPFPALCTNPAQFAQQVQAAVQGIIAVGRIASDFASFQVLPSTPFPPPPPPTNNAPVVQFTATPPFAQAGQVIQFLSNSFDPDAGDFITQHLWNFGDGAGAFGNVAFHAYALPGTYQVTLTAVDNRGAAATGIQFVTVTGIGGGGGPVSGLSGFFVTRVDNTHFKITVQGQPSWITSRLYQIKLESNGSFLSVNQAASGNAQAQGIVPTPINQTTLTLTGFVATGRVEYTIEISNTTSQVKYNLQLDSDGNGALEKRRDFVFLGSELKNPPSNPFILSFPIGQFVPFINLQVCLVLIDQPGFFLSICFNFTGL